MGLLFRNCLLFFPALFALCPAEIQAQHPFEQTAPERYRILFTGKTGTPYSIEAPGEFLSARAIERRQRQNIPVVVNDLPVNPAYLDSITAAGAQVLNVSKWLNAATVKITEYSTLERIARLTFVKKGSFPAITVKALQTQNATQDLQYQMADYGPSWWQTAIHNGHQLHTRGYTGTGKIIAVIDAGFLNTDQLPAFERLWAEGRILATRDFVSPGQDVFRQQSHGMSVLSIIGGRIPGELTGTAPDASFLLLRSEDGLSEYLVEEDNWVAAAEFADSAGADIINTSLGYTVFNDTLQNHTYADLNGDVTRISQAADIAASKGMLVIVSAGNQGQTSWRHISAPSDADSVLAIGAIDRYGVIAGFSGRGPSSDQQVKPNIVAIGSSTYVQNLDGTVKPGNGTSYSAPVITGLSACLWQANPNATAMEIFDAICKSADRYTFPDFDYGFGIPDFVLANALLGASQNLSPDCPLTVFPNPFSNDLYIFFHNEMHSAVTIILYDIAGNEVFRKQYPQVAGTDYLKIDRDLDRLLQGVYIISVNAVNFAENARLIKF